MNEPILVVMAAGMGSRYGGLKQIDPVGENGEIIIDFSLYDAKNAGFKKVVFLIKRSIEDDFKEIIGDRISKFMEVHYAYQEIDAMLPADFKVPEGREKPWGTAHAILCCDNCIDAPFAVINADDYYGKDAFKLIYGFLQNCDAKSNDYGMVGYILENTLTDHGHVARGVCIKGGDGYLEGITERTHIEKRDGKAQYTEDGESWVTIPQGSTVSMNLWGFAPTILDVIKADLPIFLNNEVAGNPLKSEYFLPNVVGEMVTQNKATVKVLESPDRWYGVTYREDKPVVVEAIKQMRDAGVYPSKLWEDMK